MGRGRRAAAVLARRLLRPKPRYAPPNPHLAWVSPMPPAPTGIASYSQAVLDGLGRIGFRERRPIDVAWPLEAKHEWLIPSYRLSVYHVGNNIDFHGGIYRHAMHSPGLVVLHDLGLDDFVRGMIARGEPLGGRARREALAVAGRLTLPEAFANEPLRLPWCADLVRHSRGVIVHSEFCRRYLEDFDCRTPVFVVPHPAIERDADMQRAAGRGRELRAELGLSEGDVLIVAAGDLNEAKRLDAVLAAARRLDPSPRVQVVLVGRRIGGYDVDRVAAASGLGSRVSVAADVPDRDFLGWLSAADVVVDLRFPHRGESSGSLARAMQAGRPAIVSGTGTYLDVPDDAVIRVAPGPPDPGELAFALRGLIEDPSLRSAIGERARAHVARIAERDLSARGYAGAIERTLGLVLDPGRRALARWAGALLDIGVTDEQVERGYGLSYARAFEDFRHPSS